ncbi:glyceraldehyde-3-phosphate dehydrogenase [Halioglobus maricola]|nr:glyceraldehyde-3-phosphate dehydrogenase [Halioglobus maricola]
MKRYRLYSLPGILLGFLAAPAAASQFTDPFDGKFDMSGYLSENAFGFLPVPIIISEPAVDQGLGLMGMFFHEDEEAAAERKKMMAESETPTRYLLPPSVSAVAAAYTGNESWMLGGGHFGFYREGRIRYQGGAGYGDINLDYYSIGDVVLPKPISLKTEALFVSNTLKFRLGELPLFLGPTQTYIEAELSPGGLADIFPPNIPDDVVDGLTDLLSADVTTSGVGFELEFDLRDNIFSPTKGFAYTLDYLAYRDSIGSDIDYDRWEFEGLNYFKFSEYWRGAVRLGGESVDSDDPLPPFAMPALDMRGIPAARYQAENVAVIEGEVTWQFTPRWSALAFAGAGWIENDSDELFGSSSLVSRGAGFRYQIARQYGMHVGIDVARGPEDTVWYIQVGSAW